MSRASMIIFVLVLCIKCIVCKSFCERNQVFSDCASVCPVTCENYQNPPEVCADICKRGCICIRGYVFNNESKCVLPCKC